MKDKLITVRTYARERGITRQWVYAKLKKGEIPFKLIDGVMFINTKKL